MKVGIYTLGCKVNTYESEYIISLLKKNEFIIDDFYKEDNDIYIINTCTVTNTSDIKSRKIINKARALNKKSCVIVMGCYVQANIKNPQLFSNADIIIGNKDKSKIVELINEYFTNKKQINHTFNDLGRTFEDMELTSFDGRTRAFVKIEDGCDNFCNYCIIPYTRGIPRSKSLTSIIYEIETLVKNGYQEIVLTGINTGNYGKDINTSFDILLKEIVKIPNLKRLRISSIEITELTNEVLEIIKDNDIIVNHLHIPIQAASDNVLKAMNRKYDLAYFIDKINIIKKYKKDIAITTDILSAHPYETEEDFQNSLQTLEKIGFAKLHVFPYSKRKGTVSAEMPQIDDKTKKERTIALLNLSRKLENNYMKKFLGKRKEVLIETNKDGYSYGHTTNYLHVKIEGIIPHNSFVSVKLLEIQYPYIIGKPLE